MTRLLPATVLFHFPKIDEKKTIYRNGQTPKYVFRFMTKENRLDYFDEPISPKWNYILTKKVLRNGFFYIERVEEQVKRKNWYY